MKDWRSWVTDRSLSVEVPNAIECLVRARVDRLGPGPRGLIVAASVLGPEFSERALAAVADLGPGLARSVTDLRAAGLFLAMGTEPEPSYRFRHSLIQEATYKGLLRGDRRKLHARAARGLEASSSGRLEEVASALGHHFAAAGEAARAMHYLWMAGNHAEQVFANDEWPDGSWQPFHWVCLWPLVAVRLAAGLLADAVEAAGQLLPDPQQRFPDELEAEVQAAIRSWERGDPEGAEETLARALEMAHEMRFA